MPGKSHIWCSHPYHDEVLSNGKKRFSKVGQKLSHPKGKRSINEQLANYINSHSESILNGSSTKLEGGDYLCSTCYTKEENLFMNDEETNMDTDDCEETFNYNNLHNDSGCQQCSPMDDDTHVEQEDIKRNRNSKQISNAIDETYFKLREWSNTIAQATRRDEKPEAFHSLNVSIDDAAWILNHLRELFSISDNEEQQRLMTMLPPDWGRNRIANWFGGSQHQARQSIELRTTDGVFSKPEDRRGNKSLVGQIELAVHNFYTSDEVSRETSYKKQVIHPPPSRKPVPLRFLHSNIGETFQQFKLKYPNMEISRSKFFSLRPVWVREQTTHESCMCIYHENADLVLQGISKSLQRLVTIKSLIEETICKSPSESCHYRQCANCRHLTASAILSDGIDIETEDSASWSIWKKLNSRYELLHLTDKYNMYNLAHHHVDFNIGASWTFSASGHGKGPCDGVGAVIKSTATQHIIKGGPNASFSSPKEFYEWCVDKNDRLVIARPRRIDTSNSMSTKMPEPNRPIEVRWLSGDVVNNEFENCLKQRWSQLSSKDSITGIRDMHQFDADTNGSISCRRTSQSIRTTIHTFKMPPTPRLTASRNTTDGH
ncbi:unnamed protein product [Rotaria sp. Silwood1]|nr:unnamed protein product [Rotaria sp. Silwood1]CAF1689319.1 unnamed protein product [Rotaria sp. Silwood1]